MWIFHAKKHLRHVTIKSRFTVFELLSLMDRNEDTPPIQSIELWSVFVREDTEPNVGHAQFAMLFLTPETSMTSMTNDGHHEQVLWIVQVGDFVFERCTNSGNKVVRCALGSGPTSKFWFFLALFFPKRNCCTVKLTFAIEILLVIAQHPLFVEVTCVTQWMSCAVKILHP